MSLGHGIIHDKYSKQKLNIKSSTELEVVEASNYIDYILYIKWVLKEQGYVLKHNIFNQDNMSAIKMEKNGMQLCGEKSRHIHIRYFLLRMC